MAQAGDLEIDLQPIQPPVSMTLAAQDCEVQFSTPADNIVLEISPALFMDQGSDNTNYLMYYQLAKD